MGQGSSSSPNNQDQDGDIIMRSDSESEVNGEEWTFDQIRGTRRSQIHNQNDPQINGNHGAPLQNGSQRVLRMTPARRMRLNHYSFYSPSTTTSQTRLPNRPITRSSSLDCESSVRERSASRHLRDRRRHGQQESHRSSSSRGSSVHQYSSAASTLQDLTSASVSSSTSTQTDTSGTGIPRPRHTQVTTHRSLSVSEANTEENNSSNNVDSNNTGGPDHILTRLFSFAAAAASLVGSQGQDGSPESFLAALQRRRQEAVNRSSNLSTAPSATSINPGSEQAPPSDRGTPGSHPMSFFHLFRSRASSSPLNSSPESSTANSTPNTATLGNGNNSDSYNTSPQMVPVIIIGIRSVPPRDDSLGNPTSSQTDTNNLSPDADTSNGPTSTRTIRNRSSSTSSRPSNHSTRPTSSTGTQTPPTRSLIIYVVGTTWPSTHPLLATPSLFTDNPTYDDMVLLSQLLGPARPPTTTQTDIEAAFPVLKYDESIPGVSGYELLGNAEKCQVCLCDYSTGEELRVLTCRHGFHRECIDKWLTEGCNKCPICRGVAVASNNTNDDNLSSAPPTLGSLPPFF